MGYTGIFNSSTVGITRFCIPDWKRFAPNQAFKSLVDGKYSRTMITFKGIDDRPSHNFFDGPFSDIFGTSSASVESPNTAAFIATIKALHGGPNDRPEGPNGLPPYELGEINPDGTSVGDRVVSPLHIQLQVTDELFNKIDPKSRNGFRAGIINAVPSGSLLSTMWGQAGPGANFEPIGQIYSASEFVASKYEDEVLFFRHPHKRWVPPYHRARNHGYNFEVKVGFEV
ncbi:hypothetical protein RvY_10252 [Ramazzottius varieornatus]|uniref:Uncharacterized protein n=1 Tax=Ramazzottius varieornatus TaxID=947166 RepID=A0A1D1VEA0_RAMVA|nr:hypothetical protein RvY_10252 [Ramazzottius varieornatus]